MKRLAVFLLLLLLTACATVPSKPPADLSFEPVSSREFGIDLPLPAGWTAGREDEGLSAFVIRSPGSRVKMFITATEPDRATTMLKALRSAAEGAGFEVESVEQSIDGIRARGFRTVGRNPMERMLLVEHPSATYLIVFSIDKEATSVERETGAYILDQLKLHGINCGSPPRSTAPE